MTRGRRLTMIAGIALLVIGAGLGMWLGWPWRAEAGGSAMSRVDARAPEATRIRVEVLNASEASGLARRGTMHLRDRGFDVVYYGTERPLRDGTVVLDRSNHPEWAALVARALGGVPVESAPDTSRYLDVTVLLGPDWAPPPEPLYP